MIGGPFNATQDYDILFEAINSVIPVNVSRFERDVRVLNPKATGDTTPRNTNFSTFNLRKTYTGTRFTPPTPPGIVVSFVVLNDYADPSAVIVKDLVNAIQANLGDIAAACISF
jgi:hypothetical protein